MSNPDHCQLCERQVRAVGLCATHYRQHRRGAPLKPIRVPEVTERFAVRVSLSAHSKLAAQGPSVAGAARDVIEDWAAKKK